MNRLITIQRPQVILTHGAEAIRDRQHVGERIGLVADLHICVGIQTGKCETASRSVVFERSGEQHYAICRQCTGQSIAFVSYVFLSLELK